MPRDRLTAALACAVWILCGAYTARFVDRGWIPHDEGTIGQSAERVRSGELPHRDFDEMYTGGLTYLHAAGMKILGTTLRAPRIILFACFMAFLAAVFAVARRVAAPPVAIGAMALATAWSVPNYFVSLPSWYNLFLATFGVLALMRFLETRHRWWLILAGACGGLSVLAKITGVYYLAGGLVFLAHLEQTDRLVRPDDRPSGTRAWPIVAVLIGVLLVALLALLQSATDPAAFLPLFIAPLAVCSAVVWREWSDGSGALGRRVGGLLALVVPFLAGAALPIAAFVVFYWQQHAVADLVRGVIVQPQRRLIEASINPPPAAALALGVPYAGLLMFGRHRGDRFERAAMAVLAVLLGTALVLAVEPVVYRAVWAVARSLPTVAAVAGAWMIAQPLPGSGVSTAARARVFLLVTMAAMLALVQFPYATPIYLCYAAPMTVLALAALVSARPDAPRRLHLVVALFFFLFAVTFVNRSYGWNLGAQFIAYDPDGHLDLERASLMVPVEDKHTYETLVEVVRQHAAGGTIFAGPDCPEVYFLSGLRNPTRVFFDFFNPEPEDGPWMNRLVDTASLHAVVINTAPTFSPRLDESALTVLGRRFPAAQRIGKFEVRWRN